MAGIRAAFIDVYGAQRSRVPWHAMASVGVEQVLARSVVAIHSFTLIHLGLTRHPGIAGATVADGRVNLIYANAVVAISVLTFIDVCLAMLPRVPE